MNKGIKTMKGKWVLGVIFCLMLNQIQAVQLSTDGTGEVLIYPYYTVNNDLNTLYSVVNTTTDPKALAIRFLEGGNGQEVLLFQECNPNYL